MDEFPPWSQWLHIKSQRIYTVIGTAINANNNAKHNPTTVDGIIERSVIYACNEGMLFHRIEGEFRNKFRRIL